MNQPSFDDWQRHAYMQAIYGQQKTMKNGTGTAGMVCGIVGLALSFVPLVAFFVFPLGVLGAVLGAVGLSNVNKGRADNKGAAITGIVTGVLSVVLFVIWAAYVASLPTL